MSSNGPGEISLCGGIEAEHPETTVEIKIKTLDSQTYTLRVNKFVPVPALKEQIATVTGVVSEQQRLICRGKVLKDEELLSAYHVEDGHTLHLVVRQPLQPSTSPNLGLGSQSTSSHQVTDPASAGATNRGNHVAPNVVLRAFSVADSPEGHPADLNRIFSTLLGSMGIIGIGTGSEREHVLDRVDRNSGSNGTSDSVQYQPATAAQRAQFDPLQGSFTSPAGFSSAPLQPIVIPDSLATLSQYLSQLRHEFSANGEGNNIDAEASGGHGLEALHSHSSAGQGGLPTPQSLAEVILSTRRMLIAQAGECLLQLANQLEGQASVTDPLSRADIQTRAVRSGVLLQNLGALFLELGRTTMTVRMGQTPSEAVVNAGPAVFISTSGPNPMMVQPLPFQPGTSLGRLPTASVHPGHGLAGGSVGSGFVPRNIDIRIRTGSISNSNRGEQVGPQQPSGQTDAAGNMAGASLLHQTISELTGYSSSTGDSSVRVVPLRTVVASVPAGSSHSPPGSSGSTVGLFYPLLARFQQINPGASSDARGSQASAEANPDFPPATQQPVAQSAVLQQNLESRGGSSLTNDSSQGNNLFPTNPLANVLSENQQGGLPHTNNSNTQATDGRQDVPEPTAQMLSRFDQLLRTIFSGEPIDIADVNIRHTSMGVSTEQTQAAQNAEADEGARENVEQGVFFSNLVRQLMPFISQSTTTDGTTPNSYAPQDEQGNSSNTRSSRVRQHPACDDQDSKRQKREQND